MPLDIYENGKQTCGIETVPAIKRFLRFSFIYTSPLTLHKTHNLIRADAYKECLYSPVTHTPTHAQAHTYRSAINHLLRTGFTVRNNVKHAHAALTPSLEHLCGYTSPCERSFKCTPPQAHSWWAGAFYGRTNCASPVWSSAGLRAREATFKHFLMRCPSSQLWAHWDGDLQWADPQWRIESCWKA